MRALKWLMISLFLLVLLIAGAITSVITGTFPLNLTLDNQSFGAKIIRYQSGLDIHFSEPLQVMLSENYALDAPEVVIHGVTPDQAPLAHITNLSVKGFSSLGMLIGLMPPINLLSVDHIAVNLVRDNAGNLQLPDGIKYADTSTLRLLAHDTTPQAVLLPQLIAPAVAQENAAANTGEKMLAMLNVRQFIMQSGDIKITDADEVMHIVLEQAEYIVPFKMREGSLLLKGLLNDIPFEIDSDIAAQGTIIGNVAFADVTAHLTGTIDQLVNLDVEFDIRKTQILSQLLHTPLPSGPFHGDINITASVGKYVKIDIRQLLARNSSLTGTIHWEALLRNVTIDLSGHRLTLEDFLPETLPEATNDTLTQANSNSAIVPDTPIPALLLREQYMPAYHNATINMKFLRMQSFGILFDNVLITAAIDEQQANVSVQEMGIGLGGSMFGTFLAKAGRTGEISANIDITSIPLSTFYRYHAMLAPLSGDITGSIDLQTKGTTIKQWFGNLAGTTQLGLQEGILSLPSEAVQMLNTISPIMLQGNNNLLLRCGEARVEFIDGVSHNLSTVLKANTISAYGSGLLDLAQEALSLEAIVTLSVLGSNFVVPLSLDGQWSTLQPQINLDGLLNGHIMPPTNMIDPEISSCHAAVNASKPSGYDPLPPVFHLNELGQLVGVQERAQQEIQTLQQKLQTTLGNDAALKSTLQQEGSALLNKLFNN